MNKPTKPLKTFVLGLFLGSLLGILISPVKGIVIRSKLAFKLRLLQSKLRYFMAKLMEKQHQVGNYAKDNGQEVITDVMHAAEKIVKEFDTITEQLKTICKIKN